MSLELTYDWSDGAIPAGQADRQRQLAITIQAEPVDVQPLDPNSSIKSLQNKSSVPKALNVGLVLDHSGSMAGRPLDTVKQAALRLVERLSPGDRLAIVAFDHRAQVLLPGQVLDNPRMVRAVIARLESGGGTAMDEGLRLGLEEVAKDRSGRVSQVLLLTDGENEHGDNDRAKALAKMAAEYGIAIHTLGFGDHWNQDVLESLADTAGGQMAYIERSEDAVGAFGALLDRIQGICYTQAVLELELKPGMRLAELKPIAQVSPEVVELEASQTGQIIQLRLGDLMSHCPRVVMVNCYLDGMGIGMQDLGSIRLRYVDPQQEESAQLEVPLSIEVSANYQAQVNPIVAPYLLALGKYRQTQMAETKLQMGDRAGAATMLQSAAATALQLGDTRAATTLQEHATRLQLGEDLSEGELKKTRIVSKTILQP
jgi:Ca-activated chloride channel homolog